MGREVNLILKVEAVQEVIDNIWDEFSMCILKSTISSRAPLSTKMFFLSKVASYVKPVFGVELFIERGVCMAEG